MSAHRSRFSGFGSGRRRGKAAGAVIACAVMLLAGCGGSVTGGGATDAPSVIVRGDTLGRNWASVVPTVEPSAGQVVVKWDKQITEDATESVIGYEVQISSGSAGPWIGAATGCKKSETKSSTRQTCTATGLADGTYYFNVAAVRKNVLTKKTRTTDFSAVSLPATLLSAPGTPATLMVAGGESRVRATVVAQAPGTTPTSYTVTAVNDKSKACTVTGATGWCDITDLANGTAYTFTATATNNVGGTSGASDPSASVTPAVVPLIISNDPAEVTIGDATMLKTSGGSGTGTVSYTVTAGTCLINKIFLKATDMSGYKGCYVIAHKAASTGYLEATSAARYFKVLPDETGGAGQSTLTVSNTPSGFVGAAIVLTTSGGSGKGAVSYTVKGTGCSVTETSNLNATAPATCIVTAKKAAEPGVFSAATSDPKTFTFSDRVAQDTLTVSNTTLSGTVGEAIVLTTSGGSGDGIVTYTVTGTVTGCSVTETSNLNATAPATCIVTAKKAAWAGFLEATSMVQVFTFTPRVVP